MTTRPSSLRAASWLVLFLVAWCTREFSMAMATWLARMDRSSRSWLPKGDSRPVLLALSTPSTRPLSLSGTQRADVSSSLCMASRMAGSAALRSASSRGSPLSRTRPAILSPTLTLAAPTRSLGRPRAASTHSSCPLSSSNMRETMSAPVSCSTTLRMRSYRRSISTSESRVSLTRTRGRSALRSPLASWPTGLAEDAFADILAPLTHLTTFCDL